MSNPTNGLECNRLKLYHQQPRTSLTINQYQQFEEMLDLQGVKRTGTIDLDNGCSETTDLRVGDIYSGQPGSPRTFQQSAGQPVAEMNAPTFRQNSSHLGS